MSAKPFAVAISDVHYDLATLDRADACFRMAIDKAAELNVPLIDLGDLTHTKAILRAEVINRLLETSKYAADKGVDIWSLVGNHSLLNEKTPGVHALEFLKAPHWLILKSPLKFGKAGFIPYQSDPAKFMEAIESFPKGTLVFGHQGTKDGVMGDYVQDPSAVDSKAIKDWRVFLGHYHAHYTLHNTVSVGNPYTLTFGEANDPYKGFLVIYEDGSFERIKTKQPKHVIYNFEVRDKNSWNTSNHSPGDKVWVKLRGLTSELASMPKSEVASRLGLEDFKFDKIPYDTPEAINKPPVQPKSDSEIFDSLVEGLNDTAEEKEVLKALWREVIS